MEQETLFGPGQELDQLLSDYKAETAEYHKHYDNLVEIRKRIVAILNEAGFTGVTL